MYPKYGDSVVLARTNKPTTNTTTYTPYAQKLFFIPTPLVTQCPILAFKIIKLLKIVCLNVIFYLHHR
jgi:hypothetical protein